MTEVSRSLYVEGLEGEIERTTLEQRTQNERIAKLEAVIKDATEYGEVSFMGVNIPFKQFRLLKEALE